MTWDELNSEIIAYKIQGDSQQQVRNGEEIFLCSSWHYDLWTQFMTVRYAHFSQSEGLLTPSWPIRICFSAFVSARGSSMQLPAPPMCFLRWRDWAQGALGDLFLILQHTWWWITSVTLSSQCENTMSRINYRIYYLLSNNWKEKCHTYFEYLMNGKKVETASSAQ